MISIRRYLMVAILGVVFGSGILLGFAAYITLNHELEEQDQADLVQTAKLVAAFWQPGHTPEAAVINLRPGDERYHRYFIYQLWRAGKLELASDGAPETPVLPLANPRQGGRYGDREGWHGYAIPLSGQRWIIVAESDSERHELLKSVAGAVLAPYVLSVPVLLLLVWFAIRRGLWPLFRLTGLVAARDSDNLNPLRIDKPVRELVPLVNAINTLLARLSAALDREKRFTADAAHELRTLLMVLRLHADNAASLNDPAEVAASMHQLGRAVDRASRTVEQLLQLARLNPQLLAERGGNCNAASIARDTLAILAPVAAQYGQSLSLSITGAQEIALPAEALQMALRNVIDNACRYSPAGSEIQVIGESRERQLRILITDGGQGLTPAQHEQFLGRFSRGHEDAPGAGLGLSIVDRILSLYGGTLQYRLKTDDQPAAAVLTLPLV